MWQQQVEEVIALQAILAEDFRLMTNDYITDEVAQYPEQLMDLAPPSAPLSCEIDVHVECPVSGLEVRIQAPVTAGPAAAGPSGGTMNAGQVHYLPPLTLDLRFGAHYPTLGPPEVRLRAAWLPRSQLDSLAAALLRPLEDGPVPWVEPGGPVCYAWADWLRGSALAVLGINSALTLVREPEDGRDGDWAQARGAEGESDSSVHSEFESESPAGSSRADGECESRSEGNEGIDSELESLAEWLLRYDAERRAEAFRAAAWPCAVCLERVPGGDCIRVDPCGHVFCRPCLATMCGVLVQEGSLDALRCPEPSCRQTLGAGVLASVLRPQEYERWEALSLQRALDRRPDVAYCPRCGTAAFEDEDHCAQCGKCHFAFCTLCSSTWHPGTIACLDPDAKLELLRARAARDGRHDPQRDARERDLVNQIQSARVIQATTRPCPGCGAAIDKTEGCNKMLCANCGAYFCWKCRKVIHGYEHFREGACTLFDQAEIDRWNAMMAAREGPAWVDIRQRDIPWRPVHAGPRGARAAHDGGAATAAHRRGTCPICGRPNQKGGSNNLMTCAFCRQRYCYLCREPLRGRGPGTHFTGAWARCRQHTSD